MLDGLLRTPSVCAAKKNYFFCMMKKDVENRLKALSRMLGGDAKLKEQWIKKKKNIAPSICS